MSDSSTTAAGGGQYSAVELSIERLILHDLPLAQRHHIAAVVERELARLFAELGVPAALAARGASVPVGAADVAVSPDLKSDAIGAQIAQSIYGSLSTSQPSADKRSE